MTGGIQGLLIGGSAGFGLELLLLAATTQPEVLSVPPETFWISTKSGLFRLHSVINTWLVDVLWAALLIVGGGGLIGIYMGATGQMREVWFWLGNEGRELLNLGRVWDIGLVVGLVLWFGMVYSVIR